MNQTGGGGAAAVGRHFNIRPMRHSGPRGKYRIKRDMKAPGELDAIYNAAGMYRTRGVAILQARIAANAPQGEIAAALGVDQTYISRMQHGQVFMDQPAAEALVAALAQIAAEAELPAPTFTWRDFLVLPSEEQAQPVATRVASGERAS